MLRVVRVVRSVMIVLNCQICIIEWNEMKSMDQTRVAVEQKN